MRAFFIHKENVMQLHINTDEKMQLVYKIARVVYAHTNASSLQCVMGFTSMIQNISIKTNTDIEQVVLNKDIFDCWDTNSRHHKLLSVDAGLPAFLMCVRTVQKMMNGNLPDSSYGATRFHYDDELPSWATALGYIWEIDDILFYE